MLVYVLTHLLATPLSGVCYCVLKPLGYSVIWCLLLCVEASWLLGYLVFAAVC